jgi:hypothetical protein
VFQHTTAIRDLKTTAYTFKLVGLIEAINAGAITVGREVCMRGYDRSLRGYNSLRPIHLMAMNALKPYLLH